MQQLGFNSDIQVGGHRFHVQTAFSANNEKIISHIFDQGRVIDQREVPFQGQANNQALPKRIRAVHQDMISEMELLYYISEKVRQIKHPLSCMRLGLVFLDKNLLDDAIVLLQTAIELDPSSPDAYNYLGGACIRKRDFAKAEEVLRRGLQLAPQYADLHYYLGVASLEQGRLPEAIQSLEVALNINPKFFQASLHVALAFLLTLTASVPPEAHLPPTSVRIKRAQDQLATVLEAFPIFKESSRMKATLEKLKLAEYGAAVDELQGLRREIQTEFALGFENEFYLKFLYGGKGRDDEFVRRYTDRLLGAVRDYPQYADLHNSLGVAYLIQCRNLFLRALEEFRVALRINPNFKRAERNLKLSENDGKGFLILLRAILK